MPSQISGVRLYKPLPEIIWCLVDVTALDSSTSKGSSYASLTLLNSQGECVMSIDRFETSRYEESPVAASEPHSKWIYEKHWQLDEIKISENNVPLSNQQGSDDAQPHWLLFSDQGAVCDALESELTTRGDQYLWCVWIILCRFTVIKCPCMDY